MSDKMNDKFTPKCPYTISEIQTIRLALESLSKYEGFMSNYNVGFGSYRSKEIQIKLDQCCNALTDMILYDVME